MNGAWRVGGFPIILLLSASTAAAGDCVRDSEVCIEGPETRVFDGIEITRDCWRWEASYTCAGTALTYEQTCQTLANRGCVPTTAVCDVDTCDQTYQCPSDSTGATVTTADCSGQTTTLSNGMEFDTGYAPSTDFGVVASTLAGVESAATGMLANELGCAESPVGSGNWFCSNPVSIFSGEALKCRKDSFSFNNCCSGSGWGVDAGLNVCSTEEELLGLAREAQRAHYIGSDCAHSNLFGCYARDYYYCAFTSKIGRIIQEQGRQQLGISWGSAPTPNCQGFTEAELQAIDFDLIDFSEYFSDVFAEMGVAPESAQMQQLIDSYLNQLQATGCSQFEAGCVNAP